MNDYLLLAVAALAGALTIGVGMVLIGLHFIRAVPL